MRPDPFSIGSAAAILLVNLSRRCRDSYLSSKQSGPHECPEVRMVVYE